MCAGLQCASIVLPLRKFTWTNFLLLARTESIDDIIFSSHVYVEQMNYELSGQSIYFTVLCNGGQRMRPSHEALPVFSYIPMQSWFMVDTEINRINLVQNELAAFMNYELLKNKVLLYEWKTPPVLQRLFTAASEKCKLDIFPLFQRQKWRLANKTHLSH